MASRAQKTKLSEWWWTVDRFMLFATITLLIGGLVLSFSASPPMAMKRSLPPFYYVERHAAFALLSLVVMLCVSFLDTKQVRRFSLGLFTFMLLALMAIPFVGTQVKGGTRWIALGPFTLQPSEFIKPAFVIVAAVLMAEGRRLKKFPGNLIVMAILGLIVSLLLLQPDFGQTMLITIIWGGMFFIASMPWFWVLMTAAAAGGGLATAYSMLPHVQSRIDRFLTGTGDNHQVETALNSIIHGGWFGVGPGEGVIKRSLPDSHTDFIFAVAGEEYGIAFCLLLVAFFTFIVLRGFWHALRQEDLFQRLAVSGLILLFGLQATINVCVNLALMPAKGMTLPFISYGGSSMLAVAIGMGLVLALTRRRPRPQTMLRSEPYRASSGAANG